MIKFFLGMSLAAIRGEPERDSYPSQRTTVRKTNHRRPVCRRSCRNAQTSGGLRYRTRPRFLKALRIFFAPPEEERARRHVKGSESFFEFRQGDKEIGYEAVVGDLENGCLFVIIDRNNDL